MYFPFEENVDSLLLHHGQPRRDRIPPSVGSRKRLRDEKFPVKRACVLTEFRLRTVNVCAWRCASALLSAPRGREQTPSSRGNVCAFWHTAERERERKERACVCACARASLPLVSFHSYFSFLCNSRESAMWSPWICRIPHSRTKIQGENLQWMRGLIQRGRAWQYSRGILYH